MNCLQIFSNTALVRPLAAATTQKQIVPVAAPAQMPAIRAFQTTAVTKDIDSAAKFIGAGAATVGVAGSGKFSMHFQVLSCFHLKITCTVCCY